MQERYMGDIGDFGKYGLLRALTGPADEDGPLRLGVVWYLAPPERNRDGEQRDYLRSGHRTGEMLRSCDPGLFLRMMGMEAPQNRLVSEIRNLEILPEDTEFHEELLDPRSLKRRKGERITQVREQEREAWNRRAMERTRDCQVVFLDPDNGLEPGNVGPGTLRARKYAFYGEVQAYLERGQSVIVYHHLNRAARAATQIHQRQLDIFSRMRRRALAMRYHRGSPRAFILVPQAEHRVVLTGRVRRMLEGPWGKHFSMIG